MQTVLTGFKLFFLSIDNSFHPCALLFIFNPASFQLILHSPLYIRIEICSWFFRIHFQHSSRLVSDEVIGKVEEKEKRFANPNNIWAWISYSSLYLRNYSYADSGCILYLNLGRVNSRKQNELNVFLAMCLGINVYRSLQKVGSFSEILFC